MAADSPPDAGRASVVYLRLRAFAELAVTEQARLRDQLAAALAAGIAPWPDDGRVVLEAPDGAAIVGLGNPELALDAAHRALAAMRDESLAVGVHLGPIKVQRLQNADAIVVGDGVDTAATVAGFAGGGQALFSSAFREALAAQAAGPARELVPAGQFVDSRLRAHDLFLHDADSAWAGRRRRTVFGLVGIAGILGLGLATRQVLKRLDAARKPAVIQLDIKPWGEVHVDGQLKGVAPPLNRLWIKPGPHTIEVKHPRYKALVLQVDLQPGEELEVKHSFAAPAKKPGLLDRLRFWR